MRTRTWGVVGTGRENLPVTRFLQPALVIGMPIGFSHAPAAKRQLMASGVPFITVEGTLGGGLPAATALNALVESLVEKPDCHCYLGK
jgi:precorrin-8X/cobalt-precorrin-8 methylmutase